MKRILSLALAAVMMLSLAACGSKEDPAPAASAAGSAAASETVSNEGRTLNMSVTAALTTLDPMNTNATADKIVHFQYADGLYRVNEATGEIRPLIAESWTISDDGLTYTFKIRENAYFANGDQVKASDVKFSFEYAMANSHTMTYYSSVDHFEAPDDTTFVMVLKTPDSAILSKTSSYNFVLSEREVTEAGDAFGTVMHSATCGAYKLSRVDGLDTYLELEACENYYLGAPEIKKISFRPISDSSASLIAFKANELDWLMAPTASWTELSSNAAYNTDLVTANHVSYMVMNYSNAELEDDNLRKAIAYAIDKQACIDIAYDGLGEVANYMYNPEKNAGTVAHDTYYEYNPELAKEYLSKSSMPNGGKLSGALQCSAGGYYEKMAVVIQNNLLDIGLEIEVTPLQSSTNMSTMRAYEYFMGVSGTSGNGDYGTITEHFTTSGRGVSYVVFDMIDGKFDWQWIDGQFVEANKLTTVEARSEIYGEIDSYVMDTATFIPIFHKQQPFAWTKDLNVPQNYSTYPIVYEWSWAA